MRPEVLPSEEEKNRDQICLNLNKHRPPFRIKRNVLFQLKSKGYNSPRYRAKWMDRVPPFKRGFRYYAYNVSDFRRCMGVVPRTNSKVWFEDSSARELVSSVRLPSSNVRNPMRDAKFVRAELNSATASCKSVLIITQSSSLLRIVFPTLTMKAS